jgi:hypothetical protein
MPGGFDRNGTLIGILLATIWSLAYAGDIVLPEEARETEVFLSKRIPVGTPLPAGQREMESLGFSCTPGNKGPFGTKAIAGTYVYCDRKTAGLIVKRWQVALVYAHGKVSAIHATYGLIGP